MKNPSAVTGGMRLRPRGRILLIALIAAMIVPHTPVDSVPVVVAAPATWTETTTADFADGTFTDTAPAAIGGGAVRLATSSGGTLFSDDFAGAASGWTPLDGTWSTDAGEYRYTIPTNYSASMVTGLVNNDFAIESRQKVMGSGLSVMGYTWGIQSASPTNQGWKNGAYMLQWNGSRLRIFRWTSPSVLTLVGTEAVAPVPVVGTWYTIRLEVDGSDFEVFIDGVSRLTATDATYGAGGIGVVGYEVVLTRYDDVAVTSLTSSYAASGTYTSNVFDGGSAAVWEDLSWTATPPTGTDLAMS